MDKTQLSTSFDNETHMQRTRISLMPKERVIAVLRGKYKAIEKLKPPQYGWAEFRDWVDSTRIAIEHSFGKDSDQECEFMQIEYAPDMDGYAILKASPHQPISRLTNYSEGLTKARLCLAGVMEEVVNFCSEGVVMQGTGTVPSADIETDDVKYIHPLILELARPRLASRQYADAVESAFKEINVQVKKKVAGLGIDNLDGVKLMMKVFSPDHPYLQVENDIHFQSGEDTQKGYMYMFAGAMSAIRNPKAHENMTINKDDAMRKLYFASMLMYKLENSIAVKRQE